MDIFDDKQLTEMEKTYEDYLDSMVQPQDLFYLRDPDLARRVVELGYRSSKDVLTRKQFQAKKDALHETISASRRPHMLFSAGCRTKDLFLLELATRERPNRLGMIVVHLYEFEGEIACHEGTLYRNCRLIAKTIKNVAEIRLLSVLDHEHVLEVIAVCSEMKKPILALYPAPECGDLCSFLSRLSNTPSLSWLLSVGAQIASGMNYLESLSLVHRDLAARNCLVEREGSIRISDLAMACEQYRDDYCHTATGLAPLRWWSWESILTTEFTMQSSVWSFGVTLWEILTLCRQKPLAHISDHQLTTLAEKYGSMATSQQVWLPQPLLSPPEIFDLMRECWQKNPTDRPTFQHIHLFLEQKCNTTIYHAV